MDNFPVLYFDGVCGLCNRLINVIWRYDRKRILRYAPLQGKFAEKNNIIDANCDTVILTYKGEKYVKSDAIIQLGGILGGSAKVLLLFRFLPIGFRNFIYDLVAKSRYKWFGKKNNCRIPNAEERAYFLD